MQILRTIFWVLLLIVLLLFSINNWETVTVKIWEGLILETKLPALVVIAFLLGLVPMWLLHRAAKWRMGRRIGALETSVRAATPAPVPGPATPLPAAPPEPLDAGERSPAVPPPLP